MSGSSVVEITRSLAALSRLWVKAGTELLYPMICPLCLERLLPSERIVCGRCLEELLPLDVWRCTHCGATGCGGAPVRGQPCPQCPPEGSPYRGVLAGVHYHAKIARCIHLFKYDRRLEMGTLMGEIMVSRLTEPLRALEDRVQW